MFSACFDLWKFQYTDLESVSKACDLKIFDKNVFFDDFWWDLQVSTLW